MKGYSIIMKTVKEKLQLLRIKMKENNISAYIVCTQDFHGSEYVGDYFKEREYLSGFTGSAGTIVVLEKEAALWTDGRYFLQAEKELEDSDIDLMKMFQPGVPEIDEYLFDKLSENGRIAFDGRTVSIAFAEQLNKKLSLKNISFVYDADYIDDFWEDRPELSKEPVWRLSEKYAGVDSFEKMRILRKKMSDNNTDVFVLSALDEIAWLLNLRGNDVLCNPVFLSYMIIYADSAVLYADEKIFNEDIKEYISSLKIEIRPYMSFYSDLKVIKAENHVLIDSRNSNYLIKMSLPDKIKITDKQSPVILMKSVKNKTEYENERKAHIKDGIAVTKFMYWLQKNVGKMQITEVSAAKKLEALRNEQEGYLGPSFTPIMAYREHGAIVHYSATEESDIALQPESFLLSDTGGHYYDGSTDITRTFPLGRLTDAEKKAYTIVLIAHLRLKNTKFPYGMTGTQLDCVARQPLWQYGMDYNHGTGHGVGYILNVHEAPNGISWQMRNKKNMYAVFEEGMITSNEPGFYCTGRFGIRHENLILCLKGDKNGNGQFMYFENLTMVPFDWDAIDRKYMTDRDISLLNEYHSEVYKRISPYLDEDEKAWLREKTMPR